MNNLQTSDVYKLLIEDCFKDVKSIDKIVSMWWTKRMCLAKVNKPNKNKKGVKFFKINEDEEIEEIVHFSNIFFNSIIKLEPTIIIECCNKVTLHLFKNKIFGIPISTLNPLGLKLFKHIYDNKQSIFSDINYVLCNGIFYGVNLRDVKIHPIVKFNILQCFHTKMFETFLKLWREGILYDRVETHLGRNTPLNLKTRTLYHSSIKFFQYYRDSLLSIYTKMMFMKNEDTATLLTILKVFIGDINNEIDTLENKKRN